MSVDDPGFWVAVFQIIWIDLLLSGDNAVVIALACRQLPPNQRVWGIAVGTLVAIGLRIVFTGDDAHDHALFETDRRCAADLDRY